MTGQLPAARFCLTNSGTGILPVCKSENDGLEARPTKIQGHSLDRSDRTQPPSAPDRGDDEKGDAGDALHTPSHPTH